MMVVIKVSIQKFNMIIMKGKILQLMAREICILEVEVAQDLQSLLEVGTNSSNYLLIKLMEMVILRSNSEDQTTIIVEEPRTKDASHIANHHLSHLGSMVEVINQTKLH